MKRLYARFVLWLIAPALDERQRLNDERSHRNLSPALDALVQRVIRNTAAIRRETVIRADADARFSDPEVSGEAGP